LSAQLIALLGGYGNLLNGGGYTEKAPKAIDDSEE